jgi:hypothetical protein
MFMPVSYPQLNVTARLVIGNEIIAVSNWNERWGAISFFWLYRNPQYVDAVERNLQESTKLLESGSVSGQGVKGNFACRERKCSE